MQSRFREAGSRLHVMNTPKRDNVLRAVAARARGRSRIQTDDRDGRPGQRGGGGSHHPGAARLAQQRDVILRDFHVGIVVHRLVVGYREFRGVEGQFRVVQLWVHQLRLVDLRFVQFELVQFRPEQRVIGAVVEFRHQPFDLRRLLMPALLLSGHRGIFQLQRPRAGQG